MSDISPRPSPELWPITDDAIRQTFEAMLLDGSWGRYHGPHCDQLRHDLGSLHNIDHVILCSSGTSAIELALRSVPAGKDDEVVLAAYDFKANFVNILTVGASPVLVDVLPGIPIMDVHQLMQACTPRTRAILVSHLHGCLAPMPEICEFARAHGIAVIEDACQCPGAMIGGRRAGTWGDIGVLSFGGSKLLTSGRGGALLTSDSAMAQRIKLYTQRGNEAYPLSEMQAAVLVPQVRQLDERNQLRHRKAIELFQTLRDSAIIGPVFTRQTFDGHDSLPAFYKVAFLLADDFSSQRDALSSAMRNAGIPLDAGFHALHLIHSRRRFRAHGDLPNSSRLHATLMTLHHTALMQSNLEIRFAEVLAQFGS